jgi:hypothetical protein
MMFVDNDRWRGVCTLYDQAIHEYTVEAVDGHIPQLAARVRKEI